MHTIHTVLQRIDLPLQYRGGFAHDSKLCATERVLVSAAATAVLEPVAAPVRSRNRVPSATAWPPMASTSHHGSSTLLAFTPQL